MHGQEVVVITLFATIVLPYVVAIVVARRHLPDGRFSGPGGCLRCGYDVRGLDGAARCPECAYPRDADV